MWQTVLEVALGALVAIFLTIWIENLRKPKLELRIALVQEYQYQDRPAKDARFLILELANKPLPQFARWMSRSAALQCHGTIAFHHLDGQNIFGRTMQFRWSNSPEPVPMRIALDNTKQILIFDPAKFTLDSRIDIYPGESEGFAVAGRFDNEDECYGWSNENYFVEPIWRNPNWKLMRGRYLVKVSVTSAGEKCEGLFRLINDVPQNSFRLEQIMPGDTIHD